MLGGDKRESGVQAAASGLLCSVGRDVFCYESGQSQWQTALKDDFSAFDLDPLAMFQPSPDGRHGAAVGLNGTERAVCILTTLPSPVFRSLPTILTRVAGMSWSPAGKRLCVLGGDPSVGILSMEGSQSEGALPVFSLFMAGKDDPDLLPITGPIALPGSPRWSPAGDAVAVVGLEHGGAQVALVVTTEGREGPLVSGERVMLGTCAWTADGLLLCAVFERRDGVHVQLVNTATGESTLQGEPWEDISWLSLIGDRVLVAGKTAGAWCVADVTGGSRRVLTASFEWIAEAAATSAHLWVVASVENGDLGLWSMDLQGEHLRLHITAPSMRGMQMRADGTTVVVLAGPAGAETVRVTSLDDPIVLDMGRRDMIMGWIDEHMPRRRPSRLHYLLMPTSQVVDDWMEPSAPGDVETGTIAMTDAPEPLPPAVLMEPGEEEQPAGAPETDALSGVQFEADLAFVPGQPAGRGRLWLRLAGAVAVMVMVAAGAVLAVQGMRQAHIAPNGTPAVATPSASSGNSAGTSVPVTPSEVAASPTVPPDTPSAVIQPPPVAAPVIATHGVTTGIWVAPTERLRVRQGAGTDTPILGYLLTSERARVLAGPTAVGTTPWWRVRCYGTDGVARLTGWVSGEYVRPSPAPVVAPVTPSAPVVRPTTATVILDSKPQGAHVTIDGIGQGVTPLSTVLPGKDISVVLTLAGYMDYATTVAVKAGTTVHLTFPLIPLGSAGN